jgi:hypothetical protein
MGNRLLMYILTHCIISRCGSQAIIGHWDDEMCIYGFNGKSISYPYDGPFHIIQVCNHTITPQIDNRAANCLFCVGGWWRWLVHSSQSCSSRKAWSADVTRDPELPWCCCTQLAHDWRFPLPPHVHQLSIDYSPLLGHRPSRIGTLKVNGL